MTNFVFKPSHYEVSGPISGICKSWGVWGQDGNITAPLFCMQRPKWIKDDACWEKIVTSVKLNLPSETEIK